MSVRRLLIACCFAALTAACGRPEPISPADAGRVASIAATIARDAPEVAGAVAVLRDEAHSPEPDLGTIKAAVADILEVVKPTLREADADPEVVFLIGVLEIWLATP